jgi:2-methylcitrate dehydratase PrpD
MGITQELAGYCSRIKFNNLSDEVIDCVKYRFLDFISVACRGSIEDPSQTVYRFISEMEKGQGVIVGTRQKAPYLYSALANGTASHSIEMDDVDNESSLHPGVVVFPSTGNSPGAGEQLQTRVPSHRDLWNLWFECCFLKDFRSSRR